MKRSLSILLVIAMLLSLCVGCTMFGGCGSTDEPDPNAPNVYSDGRDRPSSCGNLQVINGKLSSEDGKQVILRGVSTYGISTSEGFLNEPLFKELSCDLGVNVVRLALYTTGVGIVGYCTGGDQERLKQDIYDGVEFAKKHDMYAIIDWHILDDGDPNQYIEEAKVFFAEMSEKFCDYNNVIYEICNEPNGVDWPTIKRYADVIVPIIRERDPNSVIIVGTPNWSQRVDHAASSPLSYENIMYTLHFYSASHKEDLRNVVKNASQSGLPIFVTEYGITASSGGFPRDIEQADIWIELLEQENISYCMWSFSKVAEPCSAIRQNVIKYSGFTEEDYTITGLWLIDTLAKYNGSGADAE